jgi:hypothetical protein
MNGVLYYAGHEVSDFRIGCGNAETIYLPPNLSDPFITGAIVQNSRSTLPVGHDNDDTMS